MKLDNPPVITLADAMLSDTSRPGFVEPWQAELFACTHELCKRGLFSWSLWVEVFSAEIAAHPQAHEETIEQAYFRQWLAALETVLARKAVCRPEDITALAARWRAAYLHTPHGQPVALEHDAPPCAALPHDTPRGVPVAVSMPGNPS